MKYKLDLSYSEMLDIITTIHQFALNGEKKYPLVSKRLKKLSLKIATQADKQRVKK